MHLITIPGCDLYHGDCLDVLSELPDDSIDALITDPPYASGGLSNVARMKSTIKKYTNEGKNSITLPEFYGDTIDQRVWMRWMARVLKEAGRVLKPDAPYMFFIDWRQIPALMDTMMEEGLIPRGLAVWNKKTSRPVPNGFAQTSEFILWGRRKQIPKDENALYSGGVFDVKNEMNTAGKPRFHVTQKPVVLMKHLLRIVPKGALVLDPFAGSGSTGVACLEMGRRFIGIEKSQQYFDIMVKRLQESASQSELMPAEDFAPPEFIEEEL